MVKIVLFAILGLLCAQMQKVIKLPEPKRQDGVPLTEALAQRRSVREFSARELSLEEISQILWAAQGISESAEGFRTAPSAGALYPLEIYVAKKDGLYQYRPKKHALARKRDEDVRRELRKAALDQMYVEEAPCVFIITAVYERTTRKYGDRGIQYVHMEVGHAGQNILLQATALGLGGVPVGAFHDREVAKILQLEEEEKPLYLIPVGHPLY
jgi:SagB-type dehydrogenase family enzyme